MNQPFERDPYNEEETKLWYRWAFHALKANSPEPSFIPRNFSADFGRCHDLYSYIGGKVINHGYVHEEYGWGSTAYQNIENRPTPLNKEPLLAEQAKELLLRAINEDN